MIAQSARIQKEAYWILAVCVLLILVLVVALVLLRWIKRREAAAEAEAEGFFTLQDLREMRLRGDISHQEYEKLRAAIIRSYDPHLIGRDLADPVVWEAESEDGEVVWEADHEEDVGWPDTESDSNPPR
ncbi:MAG: hypothetical protein GXY44_08555 [Phycisphaerales bacterium]|nr:hypothetical protein [Phycisphaerales bacterium]